VPEAADAMDAPVAQEVVQDNAPAPGQAGEQPRPRRKLSLHYGAASTEEKS
jgi:hypothetical protein